jgi:hypothetical protein
LPWINTSLRPGTSLAMIASNTFSPDLDRKRRKRLSGP